MSKRILVVEDQPDNRQIICDMLASTDYEITEAEDGEQALAAVAKERPDPTADHGRLRGHAPNQGRSRFAIDPDHRGHVLCARWRRKEGSGGGLRRLCDKTLQPAAIAGEDSAVSVVST
jgi:CheY-like chemotaxis protein